MHNHVNKCAATFVTSCLLWERPLIQRNELVSQGANSKEKTLLKKETETFLTHFFGYICQHCTKFIHLTEFSLLVQKEGEHITLPLAVVQALSKAFILKFYLKGFILFSKLSLTDISC